jgi:hypothetical protein
MLNTFGEGRLSANARESGEPGFLKSQKILTGICFNQIVKISQLSAIIHKAL